MKSIPLSIVMLVLCAYAHAQVTDKEGNVYQTLSIGGHEWMAENLRVKQFRNGDIIQEAKNAVEWQTLNDQHKPAWCHVRYNSKNESNYGILYNYHAVSDKREIAPEGWHVCSYNEFMAIFPTDEAYDISYARKMINKNGFENNWRTVYTLDENNKTVPIEKKQHTNSTKFNAWGAGEISPDGKHKYFRSYLKLWTSSIERGSFWYVSIESTNLQNQGRSKKVRAGYSIRCVKGERTTAEKEDYQRTVNRLYWNIPDYKYKFYVTKGDVFFEDKEFSSAKKYYQKALSVFPDSVHPKQRIEEIDKIEITETKVTKQDKNALQATRKEERRKRKAQQNEQYKKAIEELKHQKRGNVNIAGQNYEWVQINHQRWLTKNLTVTRFRNGDAIPEAKTPEEWRKFNREKKPAWCHFQNDASNDARHGYLYNWYAIHDKRGLAPKGWKLPKVSDFDTLRIYLGGAHNSSFALKSKSEKIWGGFCNGTNSSGFNALPNGYRDADGQFDKHGGIFQATFWLNELYTDKKVSGEGYLFEIWGKNMSAGFSHDTFGYGYPLRCLK